MYLFNLSIFDDDEITTIIKAMPLVPFLDVIKKNSREYSQYTGLLGRYNPKSDLVKINLPKIVLRLYKSHDQKITKVLKDQFKEATDSVYEAMCNGRLGTNGTIDHEKCLAADNEDYIQTFLELEALEGINFSIDMFWIYMKEISIELPAEKREEITMLWHLTKGITNGGVQPESAQEPDETEQEPDEPEAEAVTPAVPVKEAKPKEKAKKLTAEEKAAKTRAAEQKKAQKLKEEQERLEKEKQEAEAAAAAAAAETAAKRAAAEAELAEKLIATTSAGSEDDDFFDSDSSLGCKEPVEKKDNVYVGFISIKGTFYNFSPIGKLEGDRYIPLSSYEIQELLPYSTFENINFYYNPYNDQQLEIMQKRFHENSLVVYEFVSSDLQENRDARGEFNNTGYKVSCVDEIRAGKIRLLSDEGLYRLISEKELLDDIRASKIIRLEDEDLVEGEKILIGFSDGFVGGPYVVKYSRMSQRFYIMPQTAERTYVVQGILQSDCIRESIETAYDSNFEYSWSYYRIKDGAEFTERDVISDKELLEKFRDEVSTVNNGPMGLDNIDGILKAYSESLLNSSTVSTRLKKQRLARIRALLTNAVRQESDIDGVSNLICEFFINNRESEDVERLIENIILKNPRFVDNFQASRVIRDKIDTARQELQAVQDKKQKVIEETQQIESNAAKNAEIQRDEALKAKKEELERINEKYGLAGTIESLSAKAEELGRECETLSAHRDHLEADSKDLEGSFIDLINKYADRIAGISFDGFLASKMLQAAAKWETEEERKNYDALVEEVNSAEGSDLNAVNLVDYLVNTIQLARPQYDRNLIVNLLTCLTQGFLTVFSGTPGCGKTSICNIIAKVLGISSKTGASRYIPVSVERGWTSKRDFVGYYNPLTKSFEESNRDVYDGLKMLDAEAKSGIAKFPFYILLDEANLSPMEYYWADFMNVCDDLRDNHEINLGNNNVFTIPETLHFLATMNSDHTTEILSPRLIDRAWIITLPKVTTLAYGEKIPESQIQRISWENLRDTFGVLEGASLALNPQVQKVYDSIKEHLNRQNIVLSPRADIAIRKYWCVASQLMEDDEFGNPASIVAFDYAVSQKILPKIMGNGSEFGEWLDKFLEICTANDLNKSAEILSAMIEAGNKQMKYYQFFY